MNRNRIWGITVLLAVVALGLAFISCPADTEDRELTFVNQTAVPITIITDGTPASLTLAAPLSSTQETSGTVKKTGSDIKLSSISSTDLTVKSDPYRYIDFDLSGVTGAKEVKDGVQLGSGTIVITAQTNDTDGTPFLQNENPAQWW